MWEAEEDKKREKKSFRQEERVVLWLFRLVEEDTEDKKKNRLWGMELDEDKRGSQYNTRHIESRSHHFTFLHLILIRSTVKRILFRLRRRRSRSSSSSSRMVLLRLVEAFIKGVCGSPS